MREQKSLRRETDKAMNTEIIKITVNDTKTYVNGKEKILEKFPQVILINGHVHNEIRNELCIWQGRFTNVDAGCISSWGGDLEGTIPFGKATAGVLIMEVYPDKVIFERMDCLTKEIVGEPWKFPLPHDPDNPPLAFEKRKKASVAPEFPAGSKILIRRDSKAFNELRLYFTPALPQKNVFKYEIFILDKASGKILNRHIYNPVNRMGGQFVPLCAAQFPHRIV